MWNLILKEEKGEEKEEEKGEEEPRKYTDGFLLQMW